MNSVEQALINRYGLAKNGGVYRTISTVSAERSRSIVYTSGTETGSYAEQGTEAMKRGKAEVGEVFALPTPKGLGLLQMTQRHELLGPLVRVLPGLHATPPADLDRLIAGPERFVTFVPVDAGARRGDLQPLGVYPVPPAARSFPTMKWVQVSGEGKVSWLLWNGDMRRQDKPIVAELTAEQMDLPEPSTWSLDLLVERVSDQSWSWRNSAQEEIDDAAAYRDELQRGR